MNPSFDTFDTDISKASENHAFRHGYPFTEHKIKTLMTAAKHDSNHYIHDSTKHTKI